ncbi:ribonuclease PH [Candidatus Dependentiae bacterium]|nr:MAG: ribonuclease PH [Candidatus Dependentiae bacterium]
MRPMNMVYDFITSVPGTVLVNIGNTKVLCTVALQKGVPLFLRNTGNGWLTAEYAMLPNATEQRTVRDTNSMQRNGRSIEISRLIGRALRTVVDLDGIGERTMYVDCDVLQADGGTRTAAITGASIALELAQNAWLEKGLIKKPILKERIAAVSVGLINDEFVLDPDYAQDCLLTADFNIIMTASGKLIELHGGAEKSPISWEQLEQLRNLAVKGVTSCFALMDKDLGQYKVANTHVAVKKKPESAMPTGGMFSLANRLKQVHDATKE